MHKPPLQVSDIRVEGLFQRLVSEITTYICKWVKYTFQKVLKIKKNMQIIYKSTVCGI